MIASHGRLAPVVRACGAGVLGLFLVSMPALGQAWLPPKGSKSFTVDYTDVLNKKHYTAGGDEIDVGHTDFRVVSLSGSYSPTDRVTIGASLPVMRTRYRGAGLGGHDHEIDDGNWHGTITDLQLIASYQAIAGAFALAPYLGVVIPMHDYTTFGHAAPGRGLMEYWVGTYAGMSLNDWIPRTYVQLRGNYAFVEKVAGIGHDRTNATLEIGYFPTAYWDLRAIATRQWTHGGIDVPIPETHPLFPFHDQLADEEFVAVGGGATWVIGEGLSAYAFYLQAVQGTNAHKVDHRLSLGVSYSWGGR